MISETEIDIYGIRFPLSILDQSIIDYLRSLPQDMPPQKWRQQEADKIWHNYKLDNQQPILSQSIDKFYLHPFWIFNGIISAVDPISVSHRTAIAKYFKKNNHKMIADYGGGFGELALQISKYNTQANISIIEPYPTEIGRYRISSNNSISFSDRLESNYDAVIAQDVLEHVEQPIDLAYNMANAVKKRGILIFANCFYPIIQCHLPSTFHLRHTFHFVMKAMGLKYIGRIDNCQHGQVFQRTDISLNLPRAKKAEQVSKVIGPILNSSLSSLSKIGYQLKLRQTHDLLNNS